MGYDYSGYGASSGTATVAGTLNDISACLEWLYAAGKQPSDIVLYGQSVGSGPSVYLAAATPSVAGLVLHSALASGESAHVEWAWEGYGHQICGTHKRHTGLQACGFSTPTGSGGHRGWTSTLTPNFYPSSRALCWSSM